VIEKRLNVTSR